MGGLSFIWHGNALGDYSHHDTRFISVSLVTPDIYKPSDQSWSASHNRKPLNKCDNLYVPDSTNSSMIADGNNYREQ